MFALSVPAALLVVTVFSEVWYFSLYLPLAVLALLLADLSMSLPGKLVHAEWELPRRLYVGQAGAVDLEVFCAAYSRPVYVQALLELEGEAAPPRALSGAMPPADPADAIEGTPIRVRRFRLALEPLRRGRIELTALWLRWRGPLGLVEFRRRQEVRQGVDVAPDVHGIHEQALQFFARDAVYGVKTQRLKGEGTEFDSLCEYAQGMDNRFIDWKHSARHRKLLCKEFRQERNHQIVFGFDTGHLMLEPLEGMPKLDHAIKAALLLGWISLYSGDLVGGGGFDARLSAFIKPGRGMPYFTQLQRFTARLDYSPEETNFTLGLAQLYSRLQRRALVVLFTEFVDSIAAELLLESLQRLAKKHVVVFVTMRDPMLFGLRDAAPEDFARSAKAVLADDFLRERSVVLERVARMGVHCLDVPAQGLSSALLNRYLLIKQRGLL